MRYLPIKIKQQSNDRTILLAQDPVRRDICVIKHALSGTSTASLLQEEGRLLSSLQHPCLVSWVDHLRAVPGLDAQGPVTGFAMRWVDGQPLTRGAMQRPLEDRLRAFRQLLGVVDYLHRCGILHLDIKPDNVLLAEGEGVRLLDLGSARPLDSGPGEAGGTVGYAAPEILKGQAATVAADLYSLGAVLYELLTGQRPYQQDGPEAPLSGVLVPVRVLQEDVPRPLAVLAESLLAAEPSARPRDVAEVLERLPPPGEELVLYAGVPPLVGRSEELERVGAALSAGRPVILRGPAGSGRIRLARAALQQHALQVGPALDLCEDRDPIAALTLWMERLAEDVQGAACLGRREDCAPADLAVLDAAAVTLLGRGCAVLWAALPDSPIPTLPQTALIALPPLPEEQLRRVCRFYGVHSPSRAREVCRDVAGLPGALIRKLDPVQRRLSGRDTAEVVRLLSELPAGAPESFVRSLPADLQKQIQQLLEDGGARFNLERRLFIERRAPGSPQPETLQAARDVLEEGVQGDPLWMALAAARLGASELAAAGFVDACAAAEQRPTELRELCERLHPAGHRPASIRLARLRKDAGDLSGAVEILEGLGALSEVEELMLVSLLRRVDRPEDALHRARAVIAGAAAPAPFWLEIARVESSRRRLDEAELALNAAEAADPSVALRDGLLVRLMVLCDRAEAGQPIPGAPALISVVEARREDPELPSGVLMTAVILLRRMNDSGRALPLLEIVSHRADRDEDRRTAVGARINRANILQDLGRGSQARQIANEAVKIAEEAGADDLLAQLFYLLVGLELGAGRLPEAQRWSERFSRATEGSPQPLVQLRQARIRAQLLLEAGELEAALALLTSDFPALRQAPSMFLSEWRLLQARARLLKGEPEQALALLAAREATPNPLIEAHARALEGRALIARGRAALASARAALPAEENTSYRAVIGEVLLSAAGEDLDPATFSGRRQDLEAAARLLRGEAAARAATLRERLQDGPGADLAGIVSLTESMNDPKRFPSALARMVTQALGAHRVLIMLRIPGLGQQMSYNELTGAEAAGIGAEVLRRIQHPDDYWLAADAFSDPRLRESSHTVRTFELKSLVAVAIPHNDKAMGALYVDDLYRTGRFDMEDVAILRRLARAVGQMMPLLQRSAASQAPLIEPEDVLGVLTCQPRFVEECQRTVSLLRGQRETNLLITGETGTGKSVLANRLAREIFKVDGLEVVVLRKGDPNMLVAQLTGSRRGDFTGAVDQEGAIQRALRKNRAIFLDEVQNLGEEGQQILLPLLEMPNRHFGGLTNTSQVLKGTLHVILGTNVDINGSAWKKWFREDLWYRMSVIHVHLPALRERGPEAVYRYLAEMLREIEGSPPPEEVFEAAALYRVTGWQWPGNLRQLRGFAYQAAHYYRTTQAPIPPAALAQLGLVNAEAPFEAPDMPLVITRNEVDRVRTERMLEALRRNDWVQCLAAEDLKMRPANFSKLLKRYGLRELVRERRRTSRDTSPL